MALRLIILSVLAMLACGSALAQDAPATTPRWKLRPGEALRYELTDQVTYALVPKQPPIELALRFDVTLVVRDVAPDGSAGMTFLLERVRLAGKGGGGGRRMRSIDTAKAPPGRAAVDPVLIGRPVTFRLSPRGEVRDVVVAEVKLSATGERALAEVRKDPIGAGMLPSFSTLYLAPEESLKTMLATVVIPLPPGPIKGAAAWEQERVDHNEVFDIRTAKVRYEPGEGAGQPADAPPPPPPPPPLDIPPDAPPAEGVPLDVPPLPPRTDPLDDAPGEPITVRGVLAQGTRGGDTPPLARGTFAGTLRFDPAAGRVTGGRWQRVLVFEGRGEGARPIQITHTTRSTLRLMPPPPPRE